MKLSKGVLGLKFMRKTRDQVVKTEQEKRFQVFKPDGNAVSNAETGSSDSDSKGQVTECMSFLQCERYTYARQSFGGMNPTVEECIRKGTWTIEFETPDPGSSAAENVSAEVKFEDGGMFLKPESLSSGEESDGPVMGSIIGTIGKRFHRKNLKRPHDPQDNLDEASIASKKRKKQPWKKSNQK